MLTKNDLRDFCLYSTFMLVTTMALTNGSLSLQGFDKTFSYDDWGVVECDTNSMGLTLRCGDEAYLRETNTFTRGMVYTYNFTVNDTEETTIIHRLVGCYTIKNNTIVDDMACSDYLVFMGDNNDMADRIQTVSSADYKQVLYVRYA